MNGPHAIWDYGMGRVAPELALCAKLLRTLSRPATPTPQPIIPTLAPPHSFMYIKHVVLDARLSPPHLTSPYSPAPGPGPRGA